VATAATAPPPPLPPSGRRRLLRRLMLGVVALLDALHQSAAPAVVVAVGEATIPSTK
jgi:hypothetical protein